MPFKTKCFAKVGKGVVVIGKITAFKGKALSKFFNALISRLFNRRFFWGWWLCHLGGRQARHGLGFDALTLAKHPITFHETSGVIQTVDGGG